MENFQLPLTKNERIFVGSNFLTKKIVENLKIFTTLRKKLRRNVQSECYKGTGYGSTSKGERIDIQYCQIKSLKA